MPIGTATAKLVASPAEVVPARLIIPDPVTDWIVAATLSFTMRPAWELTWKLTPDRLMLVPSVTEPPVIAKGIGRTVVAFE